MGNVYVVMGVCGCGKTTVGTMLAEATGGRFIEGDAYHPAENVAKMSAGTPLNDADRQSWLETLARLVSDHAKDPTPTFLSCSALKESYRAILREGNPGLTFIHLQGSRELIQSRMNARKGHFMPPTLVESQFATLEPPLDAITVDVTPSFEEITAEVLRAIAV